jgi:hypothetical protein
MPKFTASFGIGAEAGEELEAALRRADEALMRAKRQGRDRVALHDSVRGSSNVSIDGVVTLAPLVDFQTTER